MVDLYIEVENRLNILMPTKRKEKNPTIFQCYSLSYFSYVKETTNVLPNVPEYDTVMLRYSRDLAIRFCNLLEDKHTGFNGFISMILVMLICLRRVYS